MKDDIKDINTLAKLMEVQFNNIKERIDKSDAHFDKRLEKLENKLDGKLDEFEKRLNEKDVDIVLLKKETENTTKNWSSVISLVAGSLASIIVTVITKMMGL